MNGGVSAWSGGGGGVGGGELSEQMWQGLGGGESPPHSSRTRLVTLSLLCVSGEKCRRFIELTPPAQRGEKGLLEFATLQGSCHPTLRFGGEWLMEKASLLHLPWGPVASTCS
jgi:hypothetical protein